MTSARSITRWLGRLTSGDGAAVQPLWDVYFPRLVQLARQRLHEAPCRAADEEDVALSAFHSFYVGACTGASWTTPCSRRSSERPCAGSGKTAPLRPLPAWPGSSWPKGS